jgi:hypothetical protein
MRWCSRHSLQIQLSGVRGVGAVLEVAPTGRRQGGLECVGPFLIGSGKPEDLIRRQLEVAQRVPKPLAGVDGS